MRTQNLHDRPSDVDLAPRWLAAFLVASGLLIAAYTFIHIVAMQEASVGDDRPTVRLVEGR